MKTVFTEISKDYQDDNGVTHIDGYRTDDENAEGETIAFVIKGEVYYRNPELQFDPYVKTIVDEVANEQKKELEEKRAKIEKVIDVLVYGYDGKPRKEFTDGSPLEVKLSLLKDAADSLEKLV